MTLEEVVILEGLAAAHSVRPVIAAIAGKGSALAALVDAAIVDEEALADALARVCGTAVIDLDRGTLDQDATHFISAELASRLIAVPVAVAGTVLRVAFADPLDTSSRLALEEATGMAIQPLVATLSSVRRAIERAYGTAANLAGGAELRGEKTERLTQRAPGTTDTTPLHRIEREATIEERHEALVLALIDSGAMTRADYLEALKRLVTARGRT